MLTSAGRWPLRQAARPSNSWRYLFMRVTARPAALLVAPLMLAGSLAGVAACTSQPSPDPAVAKFLDGWRTGQFAGDLPMITADGASISGTDVATKIKTLSGDLAAV